MSGLISYHCRVWVRCLLLTSPHKQLHDRFFTHSDGGHARRQSFFLCVRDVAPQVMDFTAWLVTVQEEESLLWFTVYFLCYYLTVRCKRIKKYSFSFWVELYFYICGKEKHPKKIQLASLTPVTEEAAGWSHTVDFTSRAVGSNWDTELQFQLSTGDMFVWSAFP